MTNKEFYGDKLLAALVYMVGCKSIYNLTFDKDCAGKSCVNCEFNTARRIVKWLNAEHEEPEPPLLENGDGLKPGDWIMVRNTIGDEWKKLQFMCYFQSLDRPFVTLEETLSWYLGKHECWKYARLPMDGE